MQREVTKSTKKNFIILFENSLERYKLYLLIVDYTS